MFLVNIAACKRTPGTNQSELKENVYDISETDSAKKGAASIHFDGLVVYNFGVIKLGTIVKHEFYFKNNGSIPLIISNSYSSCGCTVTKYPKRPIMPGSRDSIIAVFSSSPGDPGIKNKVVTVLSNSKQSPSSLTLVGKVIN